VSTTLATEAAQPKPRSPLSRIKAHPVAPYAGLLLLGLIAYLLPRMGPTGQAMSLATSAMIFAIAGAGLGFLWGQSGQLSLAHAAVFGIGAYSAAIGAKFFGLSFAASIPISIGVGLIGGAIVALPSLRTSGHYFVILTFAIGEVISVVEMRWDSLTGGVNGMTTLPGAQVFLGHRLSGRADYYSLMVIFATVVFLLLCYLMRSRWGIILRSMRENVELATSLGVNVALHRIIAFAVSGALAGFAGQLHLYHLKFISPEVFMSQLSIIFLLVVLLGGKTFLLGPAVGAIVYIFLPEYIGLSPIRSQIAFGVILIVMILTAPSGLLSLIGRAQAFMKRAPATDARKEKQA
jgi:branched-chain amino acid transport system permease protein